MIVSPFFVEHIMITLDFDKMKDMTPEELEVYRDKIISDYIDSVPDPDRRRRLRGLQFQIASQLSMYKDPIAKMNKMVELFWEGVAKFNDALQKGKSVINQDTLTPIIKAQDQQEIQPVANLPGTTPESKPEPESADILQFPSKKELQKRRLEQPQAKPVENQEDPDHNPWM